MSYPAIYIELQGKTSNVPPRYIPPSIIPKSVSGSPPQSANRWCGIPKPPYPIRNSEFGIRNSETGVQEIFMVRYFPLDHERNGAVGCARTTNNEQRP